MFSLKGKVAFITGASRGLGRAMARALAQAGAQVTLAGRDVAMLAESEAAIVEAGGTADRIAFDLADFDAAAAAISSIVERHGRLDILVNNAGINIRSPFMDETLAQWNQVINTNLTATSVLTREALRPMIKQGRGRIINVGSALSLLGREGMTSYVSSKHALAGFTKTIAAEFGRRGITCNCIAPGYFNTEINTAVLSNPRYVHNVSERTTLGRWGEPAELGGAVVFLASDASSYVNGHVLVVDGGISAAIVLPPAN